MGKISLAKSLTTISHSLATQVHSGHNTLTRLVQQTLPLTTSLSLTRLYINNGQIWFITCRSFCQKFVLMAWVEASYVARQSPQWQELFNWSHHVQDTTHLPAHVIELSKDMLEFSQYLETLNQDWGSKLMSCPCSIWDEVTAFNPTRFFARTGEFHLRSLAPEKLMKSGVGSRYLCKISETNHTQQAIGILSIWPSE